jgi:glucose/arabinose dehydrogenase
MCLAAICAIAWVGCADGSPQEPDSPAVIETDLQAVEVTRGLTSPVYLTAPDSDARLFIVEQPGRIRIVENGQLLTTPFLDINSKVTSGGERGLLSVAFHPQYASNGLFFVNYTAGSLETRVERYRVSGSPNLADASSGRVILTVAQPFSNHNGGLVKFGPDGMLYIGMGDGGAGGDPQGHGQNPGTLLGNLLRIDVTGADPYRIPSDNPFASGTGGRPEIWATGLRNPWRFSFDREAGMLYIADVGQNRREEVNVRPSNEGGLNYGWNVMEGTLCFQPLSGCSQTGLVQPVLEYANGSDGCSITGGAVYRGQAMADLRGHYFYADYCDGWVRSFRLGNDGRPQDQKEWDLGSPGQITSFGEDSSGELYIIVQGGRVFRLSR